MNELLELAELLGNHYSSDKNKWEIVKAEKIGHYEDDACEGWRLEIKKVIPEGAKNECNK